MPSGDLQSKINRAIRAVLISAGAGTLNDTYAAPASDDRQLPNTTIITGDGIPFSGPGNWHFPEVTVLLRDSAVVQPATDAANTPRISANSRMTAVINALTLSDNISSLYYTAQQITALGRALAVDPTNGSNPIAAQSALDNADMSDFTCLWWDVTSNGQPKKSENGAYWERELGFSCIACNASIPA